METQVPIVGKLDSEPHKGDPQSQAGVEMPSFTSAPFLAAMAALTLGVILSALTPYFADEAYYLAWSERLSLGYFDHPPLFAWLGAAFGGPRQAAFVCVVLTSALLADCGRRLAAPQWSWIPALYLWTPLGFASFLVATPDAACTLFFALTLWGVVTKRGVAVTLGVALMLWSKHTSVIALPGLIVVLGVRRSTQCLLPALALYAPHIFWSSGHGWLPWSFQGTRKLTGFWLHDFLGGQALVLGPVMLFVLVRWLKGSRTAQPGLWWISTPILAFWLMASMVTKVEANWPALAWPGALVGVSTALQSPPKGLVRWTAGLTILLGLLIALGTHWAPLQKGPPRDGGALAACVSALGGADSYTIRYQEQALLEAAGLAPQYRRPLERRRSQFDLWSPSETPRCGGIYVGPSEEFREACPDGRLGRIRCGGLVSECLCAER